MARPAPRPRSTRCCARTEWWSSTRPFRARSWTASSRSSTGWVAPLSAESTPLRATTRDATPPNRSVSPPQSRSWQSTRRCSAASRRFSGRGARRSASELARASRSSLTGRWETTSRAAARSCTATTRCGPPSARRCSRRLFSDLLESLPRRWGASSWRWLPQTPLEGRPQLSVSCMWAVADFTASNGATRFLPGSHTWYRDGDGYGEAVLPPGVSDAAHAVQAAMRKGSCVLWAGGTLHGASGQRKGNTSSRRGLLFIYNLGYLKPEHNFHWSMPHEVMMTFGERLLDLIGYTGANAVDHPWYTGPVYTLPYQGGATDNAAGDSVHL
mmetsp:Transcript_41757/g.135415  ORF Transcript_41757/g.135415 Transcript_41757/m.135415 type:complete len:328 (+) Transcript_41757:212-1195(+)